MQASLQSATPSLSKRNTTRQRLCRRSSLAPSVQRPKAVPGVLITPSPSVSAEIAGNYCVQRGVFVTWPSAHQGLDWKPNKMCDNSSRALEMWAVLGRQNTEKHFCPIFSWVNCCPGMTFFTKICVFSVFLFSWPLSAVCLCEWGICIESFSWYCCSGCYGFPADTLLSVKALEFFYCVCSEKV